MNNFTARTISVFCSSARGSEPEYETAAADLGSLLGRNSVSLLYGGGATGLMGTLATACLGAGGNVIGIIPEEVRSQEAPHLGLSVLRSVKTLDERKHLMIDEADAMMILPGGVGTLDELFFVLARARMGLHKKYCGLLNTNGYFSGLIDFLKHAEHKGFLKAKHLAALRISKDPHELFEQLHRGAERRNSAH